MLGTLLWLGGCAAVSEPAHPAEAPAAPKAAPPARFADPPMRFDPDQPRDRPPDLPGPGYHCHWIAPDRRFCHSGID